MAKRLIIGEAQPRDSASGSQSGEYHATITDWPEGERPREKMMATGPAHLSEAELLAILIRTGTRKKTAVDLAKSILSHYGNLPELSVMSYQELLSLKGIGPAKAVTLVATFELARRLATVPLPSRLKISEPAAIFRCYSPTLGHLQKEVFMILILNSANHLLKEVRISEGILNSSLVHPREVFKEAILESAASIILLHNHPSGEVTPSNEDRLITRQLQEAGKLLNIPVLDHIIIGNLAYFSFREAGLISE